MQLKIDNPVLAATGPENDSFLIAESDFRINLHAKAQTWDADEGYSEVGEYHIFCKFLYFLQFHDKPTPWQEPRP